MSFAERITLTMSLCIYCNPDNTIVVLLLHVFQKHILEMHVNRLFNGTPTQKTEEKSFSNTTYHHYLGNNRLGHIDHTTVGISMQQQQQQQQQQQP